jgi:C4-dicarboxylate-binding protein DctP
VGVRVLSWQSAGNQVLFSKGNVASPDEFKDKKIRVTGEAMARFAKHCGGKPTVLSAGAIHEALKGGTIDMAMAAISTVTHRELWKVSDTVTRTAHAPIEFLLVANERTWQALSESHRTIIMEAARHSEQRVRNDFTEVEAGYFEFARQKGMKIRDLTPDQVAEWRACGSENLVGYMEKSADLGRQLMAAYAKLRADQCCTAGHSTAPFNRH